MWQNVFKEKMNLDNRGLSLVEVILATALIVMVVVALFQMGVISLRDSNSGQNQNIATRLTEEALEIARAERDQDSDSFFSGISLTGNGYYSLDSEGFSFHSAGVPTLPDNNFIVSGYDQFYRVIFFNLSDSATLEILVRTYWRESGDNYRKVESATILTKWR